MNSVIIYVCLFDAAFARPQQSYNNQVTARSASVEGRVIQILREDRVHPEDGSYSFDFETENGIVRSEAGSKLLVGEQPVGQQGSFSYPLPNGETFTMRFVANENGYQPESNFLPVAPEFPHPIPQFVLDQIAFAAQEDAATARAAPSERILSYI